VKPHGAPLILLYKKSTKDLACSFSRRLRSRLRGVLPISSELWLNLNLGLKPNFPLDLNLNLPKKAEVKAK
jgi:hypothetical protein